MSQRGRSHSARQLVVLAVLLLLLTGCREDRPWNVVLVTFDTTRADRIGSYGNRAIETPTLDGLASQGVRFANAMSVAPITAPSHSSILTGLYPTAHGFRDNGLFVLDDRHLTLAEMLREHGYATAAAVGAFPVVSRFGFDQGFDLFDDHLTGMYEDYLGERAVAKKELFFDERRAAQVNEAVLPWLKEHTSQSDQPFFLWLHYFDPHQPFEPPPPYDQLYAADLYNGEIAYTDSRLGHLLDQLEKMGELDRTLIVMTADHGEGLGEHNEITHAVLAYDSTLHVPLIMRPPEMGSRAGTVIEERVGVVDIVPTILDLLGLEIPEHLHGHSLASMWTHSGEVSGRETRYTPRYYAENLSPRLTHGWGELRVLYEGDIKYIHGPRPELYDLDLDPGELNDLAQARPGQASRMRDALAGFIKDHAAEQATATQKLDPELIQRLQSLGYLHGSSEGGVEVREELIDEGIAPQDRVTDLNRMSAAKHLLFDGRPADALVYTSKLVETGGGSPVYQELHAVALAGVGRIEEAWDIAQGLRSSGMVSESLVLRLAAHRFEQLDRPSALAFLERYAASNRSARAYWLLSSMHKRMQREGDSLEALERALEIEPDFVPARVDLAVHWARMNRPDQARSQFRRALEQNPYYPKASYNYGAFLAENGQLDQADRYFRRALELSPDYLKAYLGRVAVQVSLGDREQAMSALQALKSISPESEEAALAADLLGES